MHKPQELNVSTLSMRYAGEVHEWEADHQAARVHCGNTCWLCRDCRVDLAFLAHVRRILRLAHMVDSEHPLTLRPVQEHFLY
jgi:hypothetical protein